MSESQQTPKIPLPKRWKKQVQSTVLHVISLAQYAAVYTRAWTADSVNSRVRLKAELDRADQELLLLREEIRIKDARLARAGLHLGTATVAFAILAGATDAESGPFVSNSHTLSDLSEERTDLDTLASGAANHETAPAERTWRRQIRLPP